MRSNGLEKPRQNPFAGKFNGKYTVIVEHDEHNELIEVQVSESNEIQVKKLETIAK